MSKYVDDTGMSRIALAKPFRYRSFAPEMSQDSSTRLTLSYSPSPSSCTGRLFPSALRKSMSREASSTTQLSTVITFLMSAMPCGPDAARTTGTGGSEPSARRRA